MSGILPELFPPPQPQHIFTESKSLSSNSPQKTSELLYAMHPSPVASVAWLSISVHSPILNDQIVILNFLMLSPYRFRLKN